ncbi:hypothetical protein A2U01_0041418, partial [Trifolium medium]|nr:hypothetical protein [Trifolium medium]
IFSKVMAEILSILNVTASDTSPVISSIKFLNQIACVAHIDAAIYSASQDDSEGEKHKKGS